MKKTIKRILLLCVTLATTFAMTTNAYANVIIPVTSKISGKSFSVRIATDKTFRWNYGAAGHEAAARRFLTLAARPFKNTLNATIYAKEYVSIGGFAGDCPLPVTSDCTTAACGASHSLHHKRFHRAFYNAASYGTGTSMTQLYFVHHNGCHNNIIGLAYLGGTTLGTNMLVSSSRSDGSVVRVAQHEMSHIFGCLDASCTPGQRCIMNGGFDNDGDYFQTGNIWCNNCLQKFWNFGY